MSWQGIWGHDHIALRFARAERRGRLGGSFLFVGPEGVGKRSFAFALAKTLLCTGRTVGEPSDAPLSLESFAPCGVCESCRQFSAEPADTGGTPEPVANEAKVKKIRGVRDITMKTDKSDVPTGEFLPPPHPDFFYVCKPPDKTLLPLELLVGDKANRMQSGVCYEVSRKVVVGRRKVVVIDDTDLFNPEGANALLKTLEEPPADAMMILLGTNVAKQLPTIRSRCQIVRFLPLPRDEMAELLVHRKMADTPERGLSLAEATDGSLRSALEQLDESGTRFRGELDTRLTQGALFAPELARIVQRFVDSKEGSGKEKESATVRRARLRYALGLTCDFFMNYIRATLRGPDAVLPNYREPFRALAAAKLLSLDAAMDCVECSAAAVTQIEQMVNLPYIIDVWADRIACY